MGDERDTPNLPNDPPEVPPPPPAPEPPPADMNLLDDAYAGDDPPEVR